MTSKLLAAEIAERAGIALAIANGTHEYPVARALGDSGSEGIGTLFLPLRKTAAVLPGDTMQARGEMMIEGWKTQ